MFMNLCDKLSEEHTKFMFTLVHRKNFGIEENVNKFKYELLRYNHLTSILGHLEFEHCKY
jgi:hypothetical protein